MGKPRLFGADYSVYVRIARMTLTEKGVDHELISIVSLGVALYFREFPLR